MSPFLRVDVLGPVQVCTIAGAVALPGATTRALVAALALAAPGARSVEALTDDIWGDEQPQNPRASLQTLVSRLRAATDADLIRSTAAGYALGDVEIDLHAAQRHVEAAERDPDTRVELTAAQALALWRGDPGADLGSSPVAVALAEVAESVRTRLDTALAAGLTAQGRDKEAVQIYTALAAANPYDETASARLMTALDAGGRTAEALAVFAALRERLRDDLGATPGSAITEVNAGLLRAEGERGIPHVRIGLRAAPNELLGRDGDMAALGGLLNTNRVVTVLGTGGLGKTRLAQAAAAASDAPVVVFVPLASIRAGDDVAPTIASTIGISEATAAGRLGDPRQRPELRARLVAALSGRRTLLVLDNSEQVIDGVAAWVSDMLGAVPSLRVLTTSRTALAIAGEAVYPLAPLGADDGDGPAVRLFLERARAARPTASLPLDVVTRLCTHLDGLPLAIELAAARVRTMTPAQIEERLRDRFALLTTGDRTAPDRHRTLEAVIAWSWDLLDAEARDALARLAVLPAGFSAATAAGVLGRPVDDVLDRLASQSLLVVVDDAMTGDVRFRMLETVREFGLARLAEDGETGAAWDAAFAWLRALADAHVSDALDPAVFAITRAENDNLLAVLRHAIDQEREPEIVLAFALLAQGWMVRGLFEEMLAFTPRTLQAAQRTLAGEVPPDALVLVLTIGVLTAQVGESGSGARGIVLLRRARLLRGLSPMFAAVAEVASAATTPAALIEALDRVRADPDRAQRMIGELALGQFTENEGESEASLAANRRAWELATAQGQVWIAAMAASNVAQLASQSAQPADALVWLDRAAHGFHLFGAEEEMQQQKWLRASVMLGIGRIDEARRLYTELTDQQAVTPDGLELASLGWFGLAEVDRLAGDTASAVEHYRRAVDAFATGAQRSSPWYLMAMAGFVAVMTTDAAAHRAELARWVRRLRGRTLAAARVRPGNTDKPVLGTVLAGIGAWAVTDRATREMGFDVFALAERLGARQDLPSLRLDTNIARAVALADADGDDGATAMQKARDAASALSSDDRAPRALALLRDAAPRAASA